jgi:acylphosphatase
MTDSTADPIVRAHILVSGLVQGVGYRAFAHRVAVAQGLTGGVRNLDDGRVELDVEGRKSVIEALLGQLHTGPPAARVTRLQTEWGPATGRFTTFGIWY